MSWILGSIAGIAEFTGAATTEAVGSEAIGQVVGGTIAGEVTGAIEGAIDTATSTVIDTIFGPDVYERGKKQFYSSIEEAKALGLFSGEIGNEAAVLQTIKNSNYTEDDLINKIHNFAHDFSDAVSKEKIDINVPIEENSALGDLFAKLSQANPVYYFISKELVKDGKIEAPLNDPEYQAVASVYNGKGLYDQFTKQQVVGNNTEFSIIDEIGKVNLWKYAEYNTYTVVPPLWGTWVGINSPNSKTPLRGFVNGQIRESFLDKICMMHDISYHDRNSFNKLGDFQLLARASQNKDLFVLPGELEVANIAIAYFSSLGAVARRLMGPEENKDPIAKLLMSEALGIETTTEDLIRYTNAKPVYGNSSDNLARMILSLDLEID